MESKELFIFENGQPLTTPPPQVSFWAFRLTVPSQSGTTTNFEGVPFLAFS